MTFFSRKTGSSSRTSFLHLLIWLDPGDPIWRPFLAPEKAKNSSNLSVAISRPCCPLPSRHHFPGVSQEINDLFLAIQETLQIPWNLPVTSDVQGLRKWQISQCVRAVVHGGGSVMVWGSICLDRRTDVAAIDGSALTDAWDVRNRDEVLDPVVRPFAGALGKDFVLMHDNVRPHTARVVQAYL